MASLTETELILLLNEKISDIADGLMLHYNPCEMEGSSCKVGDPNPCCKHTRFGTNGCPFWHDACTFRNVECKIWFCGTAVTDMDEKCLMAFKLLEQLALLFDLTKRPLIGEPYVGADRPVDKTQ